MSCCQTNPASNPVDKVRKSGGSFPSALALLLLALPKCPICVVAYTGAITMCGATTASAVTGNEYIDARIYLALVISAVFTFYFIKSYRNQRYRIFPVLVACSGLLFLIAQSLLAGSTYYYMGVGLTLLSTLFLRSPLRNFIIRTYSRLQSKSIQPSFRE